MCMEFIIVYKHNKVSFFHIFIYLFMSFITILFKLSVFLH
jgi:hypothetical protein